MKVTIFVSMDERTLNDFRYWLKVERSMSPNTVSAYGSDVAEFFELSGCKAESASSDDINDYLAKRSKTIGKRSQARTISALRSFFNWTILENMRKDNPCDGVDAPKLGRYLPDVLSVEDIEAIMDSVDLKSETGVRDRAILEVLYGCGLRVSELAGLKLSDIFAEQGFVRIVGKGNKQRLVPIGGMALQSIAAYMECRPDPDGPESEDIVFLNRFGRPLSRVSVFNMVKKQTLLAGVRKSISPHTFRHSFATHMIENGADLRVVQEMLGHESILTTEIYTHIDSSTWQANILDHHPRRKAGESDDNEAKKN